MRNVDWLRRVPEIFNEAQWPNGKNENMTEIPSATFKQSGQEKNFLLFWFLPIWRERGSLSRFIAPSSRTLLRFWPAAWYFLSFIITGRTCAQVAATLLFLLLLRRRRLFYNPFLVPPLWLSEGEWWHPTWLSLFFWSSVSDICNKRNGQNTNVKNSFLSLSLSLSTYLQKINELDFLYDSFQEVKNWDNICFLPRLINNPWGPVRLGCRAALSIQSEFSLSVYWLISKLTFLFWAAGKEE